MLQKTFFSKKRKCFLSQKNKENEEIIHPRDVTESGFEKTLMYLFVYIRLNKKTFLNAG